MSYTISLCIAMLVIQSFYLKTGDAQPTSSFYKAGDRNIRVTETKFLQCPVPGTLKEFSRNGLIYILRAS